MRSTKKGSSSPLQPESKEGGGAAHGYQSQVAFMRHTLELEASDGIRALPLASHTTWIKLLNLSASFFSSINWNKFTYYRDCVRSKSYIRNSGT